MSKLSLSQKIELSKRAAVAKAINNNMLKSTSDDYRYGSHMFDMLLNGRVDVFFSRPGLYQNITCEDIYDYIKFRQTADDSVVREKQWLTGNPDQYVNGYIAKQWQIAGSIAEQALSGELISKAIISEAVRSNYQASESAT